MQKNKDWLILLLMITDHCIKFKKLENLTNFATIKAFEFLHWVR